MSQHWNTTANEKHTISNGINLPLQDNNLSETIKDKWKSALWMALAGRGGPFYGGVGTAESHYLGAICGRKVLPPANNDPGHGPRSRRLAVARCHGAVVTGSQLLQFSGKTGFCCCKFWFCIMYVSVTFSSSEMWTEFCLTWGGSV